MSGTPFGRYELLRKIAAGGMAEILLARQWGDGGFFRDVVIKRLFPHMAEHEKALEMFLYEGRLLAELCHPNIPQVFDLGCIDRAWYVAMEHVDGHTVADLWRAGARNGMVMPMSVAIGIVMQTCEALHHAHERRDRAHRPLEIVHRDVTPHNIMLTHDGVAKLMDFGVAQTAARRDTEAGTVKGTFSYMAPEQVRAKVLDRRADVFALGVILYELTTGTRLFRGSNVQVMTAIVEEEIPPPSVRVPDYPEGLEHVVMAALAREKAYRVPSAAHMARALEDFALRSGVMIGPRTVAKYVSMVYPYERAQEVEMAMVAPKLEVVEEVPSEPPAEISDAWVALGEEDLAPGSSPELPIVEAPPTRDTMDEVLDSGLHVPLDVDTLFEETDQVQTPESRSVPPPALDGFDEPEPAPDEAGDGDFLADLERRLEEDSE